MKRSVVALWVGVGLFGKPFAAQADTSTHFGHGARTVALMRADVAGADATAAPVQNPAFAAEPGPRFRIGYMHGFFNLRIDEQAAPVRDVGGIDAAIQLGFRAPHKISFGLALSAHLPDDSIARIGFRPGTEPQFFRYESVLQRAAFDIVAAGKKGPVALGVGAAFALDMGGPGTSFNLAQDAQGTYADAASDIRLAYRVAPLVGLSLDFRRISFGAMYRGALAIDLSINSEIRIALNENPLNGTTSIAVRGASGYEPARASLGTKIVAHRQVSIFAAMEYQRYRDAPPPVANVTLDVRLGTSPGRTEVEFVAPRFRDILVPRLGIEWSSAAGRLTDERGPDDQRLRWAARAGYAFEPSPVPRQTGFTTYADASSHAFGLGGGVGIGRHWGVDLRFDLAGRLSVLTPREERKASPVLPYAHYTVSGNTFVGAISLEGAFR